MPIRVYYVYWAGGDGTVEAFNLHHAEAECVIKYGVHPSHTYALIDNNNNN